MANNENTVILGTDAAELLTGGAGNDILVGGGGNDTLNGAAGFNYAAYYPAIAAVEVDLAAGLARDGQGGTDLLQAIQGAMGSAFGDTLSGSERDDVLIGLDGNDRLLGLGGDDILNGGLGDDRLDGGGGSNRAAYGGSRSDYLITGSAAEFTILDRRAGGDGTDTLLNIQLLHFADGAYQVSDLLAPPAAGGTADQPFFTVIRAGVTTREVAAAYSGPVAHLQYQYLGSTAGEVVIGTAGNDFINLLGGDDAADGGAGEDVLDGGTGSNFLTGGAGRDVFFLDGREGTTTWATITDWEAGEQLSIWGWRPGVSRATWVDSAGAEGWKGVTLHGDLDGDGRIDTSVTWAGLGRGPLPAPLEFDGLLWFT